MPIDPAAARLVFLGVGLIASAQLAAFEPGSERICEPSADGQRFECRDASGVEIESTAPAAATESATEPVRAPEPEPEPAPTETAAPVSDAAPSPTGKLPNYLFHSPGSAPRAAAPAPASAPAPAPASRPAAPASPAAADIKAPANSTTEQPEKASAPAAAALAEPREVPATAPATKAPIAPAKPASSPAPASAPVKPAPERAGSAPVALPPPAATRTPVASAPALESAPAPRPAAAARPGPEPANPANSQSRRPISNTAAFMALPGSHYTLVLDSARSIAELDSLASALEELPGELYLLSLNMPDGRWYSLCWSDFETLDAARAARASLPADAPIASGWPRRINLLQSEIK